MNFNNQNIAESLTFGQFLNFENSCNSYDVRQDNW